MKNKVIVVTGGTSGIGDACVRYFAGKGAKVIAASIQEKEGQALAAELQEAGSEVRFVFCDVSNEESVSKLAASAVEIFGRIDAVHANPKNRSLRKSHFLSHAGR